MSLAPHVATLGRGPGRSRSLTFAEAADAMRVMLSGEAAPEAIGALLMLLRMKGETAEEIAGFASAARGSLDGGLQPCLDWPSYAAGRSRGRPWFLLAARLVAQSGHRVLLHGWNGSGAPVRAHLADAGIPMARTLPDAASALDRNGIAYLPLECLHPALLRLLALREVFGLRSCINTVCRMLNPGRARAGVQGVFHPSYRQLQTAAARHMGWPDLTVIKGGGGEFERHPGKAVTAVGLRKGRDIAKDHPARIDGSGRLAEGPAPATTVATLWRGTASDSFAEAAVVGTAALALETLGVSRPEALACRLWESRSVNDAEAA